MMRSRSSRQHTAPHVQPLESRRLLTTWTVNTLSDAIDDTDGLLTLREAVEFANAEPAGDAIVFQPGLTGAIRLDNGEIEIAHDLTITGPGASDLAVDGNGFGRVFVVDPGAAVSIADLTVRNGRAGLRQNGGGIYNEGSLTLARVVVSGNAAGSGGFAFTTVGARGGSGGGIYNAGDLTVRDSAIVNNSAGRGAIGQDGDNFGGRGGNGGDGGGIYNDQGAYLTVLNSTVAENRAGDGGTGGNALFAAPGGAGGDGGNGGGIASDGTSSTGNVTVTGNSAGLGGFGGSGLTFGPRGTDGGGGGLYNGDASFFVANTLVAVNDPGAETPDVAGGFTSGGHNLIGAEDGSLGWDASDRTGTGVAPLDAKLGALGYYGGLTPTIPLLAGSPAIDGGAGIPPSYGVTTDQRGYVRSYRATDIGAFEAGSGFAGDADRNDKVEFADLLALAKNYGKSGIWEAGDFDGSGTVDFADLLALAKNYGRSTRSFQPPAMAPVAAGGATARALPAGGEVTKVVRSPRESVFGLRPIGR